MIPQKGRFFKAFEGATFAVVALGFLSLYISTQISLPILCLLGGVLYGAWGTHRRPLISDGTWRLLVVFLVVGLGASYSIRLLPSLTIASVLVIFLQVQRLYMRQDNRDYAYLYLLAFLQLLLGCMLTISPAFAFVLIAYLVSVTWALLLYQLKLGMDLATAQKEAVTDPGPLMERFRAFVLGTGEEIDTSRENNAALYAQADGFLTGSFVTATTVVTLLMLVLTLAVFLTAPRLNLNIFRGANGNRTHVAGFSDSVSLGDVGAIQGGDKRVMRVKLRGPLAKSGLPLYWRGAALDTFDGRVWGLSRTERVRLGSGQTFLNPGQAPRADLVQDITLEPLDSEALFAIPNMVAMEGQVPYVYRAVTGAVSLSHQRGRFQYTAYSNVDFIEPSDLRAVSEEFPPVMREIYLQSPDVISPRLAALALDVTALEASQYDKILALESWLATEMDYSLEMSSQGESPVEDFLFRTQSGHCEYFASSMVMMARSLGYPARLVTGFAGAGWNDLGGYYTVSQSNAHAWVEVYFNRYGWRRFDPTPPTIVAGMGAPQSLAEMYIDYMESLWYFYILDFGFQDQLEFAQTLFQKISFKGLFPDGNGTLPEDTQGEKAELGIEVFYGLFVFMGSVVLVLVLLKLRTSKSAKESQGGLKGEKGDVRRYLKARQRLESVLRSESFPREGTETLLERAKRVEMALGPSAPPLRALEGDYYRFRFGGQAVTAGATEKVSAVIQAFKILKKKD